MYKKKNQKETKQKFKLLEAARRRAQESLRYVSCACFVLQVLMSSTSYRSRALLQYWNSERLNEDREMWLVRNSAGRTFHVQHVRMKNERW